MLGIKYGWRNINISDHIMKFILNHFMNEILKKLLLLFCCCFLLTGYVRANQDVSKVYVVFKTHRDGGFTDLSSVVERN